MREIYEKQKVSAIERFCVYFAVDEKYGHDKTTGQHGFALRSSNRSESGLQNQNHEAAFSVVDCYPHGERGFFFGESQKRKKPVSFAD
jgi:hypothetical protein